jgi:hypothetical protein
MCGSDVSENAINGSIPTEVGNLVKLDYLYVAKPSLHPSSNRLVLTWVDVWQ